MNKPKILVSSIGVGSVPTETYIRRKYERETLTAIGLYPTHYTSHNKINTKPDDINKNRFSTNYLTREEFIKDREIIVEYLDNGEIAPEELVNKVAETVKELGLY